MSALLTVFIAAYERPGTLIETVRSVLPQVDQRVKVIVSDNSESQVVWQALEQAGLAQKVGYIRRGALRSVDHFNAMVSDVSTPYFMIFHDDDLMLPGLLNRLMGEISTGEYAAVACNAYVWKNQRRVGTKFPSGRDMIFRDKKELVLTFLNQQLAPLPSYIYHTEKLGSIRFTVEAGKYSDALWLLEILHRGKIKWIREPLMLYTVHGGQDSAKFDYGSHLRLLKVFRRELEGAHGRRLRQSRLESLYADHRFRATREGVFPLMIFFGRNLRIDLALKLFIHRFIDRLRRSRDC